MPQPGEYAERYGNFTLTPRDLDIIEVVWRYRMLESRHIQHLVDGSNEHIGRRLQGLFHNRYLLRTVPRERIRTELNPKTPHAIYGLERNGWRVLLESGRARPEDDEETAERWRKAHGRITTHMAEHQVMISNYRCQLELACRQTPGVELAVWGQSKTNRVQFKRGDVAYGVQPDAVFTLMVNGAPRYCFLEADRSTMELSSSNPYRSTIQKKLRSYWLLLASEGYARGRPNYKYSVVLFLTSGTEKRLEGMMETLRGMEKPSRTRWGGKGWFWFGLEAHLALENPASALEPMWETTTAPDELRALV